MARIDDGTNDIELISLTGTLSPRADEIQDITRPGVDGHAFRRTGERAPAFQSRLLLDLADPTGDLVLDTVRNLRDMQGKVVTIDDDHGFEHSGVVCLAMTIVRQDKILAAGGGVSDSTPNWLIEARATFQPTLR